MEKQTIKTILADRGINENTLAKTMGLSLDELYDKLEDANDDFLKKIEKTLGVENLFYMPEYGDNNTVASNNNSNNTTEKLLEIIEKQNELIQKLSLKMADIAEKSLIK